jgi:hypothetical protein
MLHEGYYVTPVLVYLHRWVWSEDPFYPHYDPQDGVGCWNNQYQQGLRGQPPSLLFIFEIFQKQNIKV